MNKNRKRRGNEYTSFIYGCAFVISSFIIVPLINHLSTPNFGATIARVLGVWAGLFVVLAVVVGLACMRVDAQNKRASRNK